MAQEATQRSPKVLANQQTQKATTSPTPTEAVAVKKERNKRAKITDHFPWPSDSDPAATKAFETFRSETAKAWEHIVATARKHNLRIGSHFSSGEHGEFYSDLLAYSLPTVLRLANKAQHNKEMDSYSDATEVPNPIASVREVDAELIKGVWSQRGEGVTRYTLLERAVAEMNGRTPAEAREALEAAGIGKVSDFESEQQAPFKVKMAEIQQRDAAERLAAAQVKAKGVTPVKLFK